MKTTKNLIIIFAALIVFCNFTLSDKSKRKIEKIDYTLPMKEYKARMTASDPATWKPVAYKAFTPTGGVEVFDNGLFKPAMEHNIYYLLHSFSNDHMLEPFRVRANRPFTPDTLPQVPFWDTDLRGSNAGRFLMGAGNTLRWIENPDLRKQMNSLIDGIEACREPDGYILPFHPDGFPAHPNGFRSEEPNYARAWLVYGLLDAAIAGNPKAYGLLRGHTDWFNRWDMLPKLLHYFNNSAQGHVPCTMTYLSPIGKPEDLQAVEKSYVCDWLMDALEAEHEEAVWLYPLQNPHSYLITTYEAYLDHYTATGDVAYLNAVKGAWNLIHDKWEHTGGSIAICEMHWMEDEQGRRPNPNEFPHTYPPGSYYITSAATGEICGNVFWIKLNQRFHQLFPDEEKYMAEIEKTIYNMALLSPSNEEWGLSGGTMEGSVGFRKTTKCSNSCCEGQSTRMAGSLPENIYSTTPDGLYVNLFEPSSIQHKINGQTVKLTQETRFPFDKPVSLKISASSPVKMKLHIRTPYWATTKMDISVNGKKVATGKPGAYVTLSRDWKNGDRIDFSLPAGLRKTKYEGADTIPGYDRYALEYGPVLLSSVADSKDISEKYVDLSQLKPDASLPLNFITDGEHPNRLIPYFMLKAGQGFTNFPADKKSSKTIAQEIYKPDAEEKAIWDKLQEQGIDKIAFVKRFSYNPNHYYTEHINSTWKPGGNICLLSLRTGEVTELVPSLRGGVFGSFDISFDAKRIVFAYKASEKIGYRLYEVGVDGKGLRQLTFSPDDEEEIIRKYTIYGYIHGTEDLDPCYLPDGGIAFVSTRCRYATLCDEPDILTTTVLYRMDKDGKNMRKLTNSSVSESTPCILPDGRILYTRWEYVDKGAISVKCLWAMNPDGTNSVEIFGNDIDFPTTRIMARPIPNSSTEYVLTGTPHSPQAAVGAILRVDVTKDIRTHEPITFMTPQIKIQQDDYGFGFSFRDPADPAKWVNNSSGENGPLFRESFPLSRSEFIVSHKPKGFTWDDPKAYQLALLYEGGKVDPVYTDTAIACFRPMPLLARETPPAIPSKIDKDLADKQLAECIVVDVYQGMTGIERGAVKYLRVLEQVPRPWSARRTYKNGVGGDNYDQQHAVISKDTHLGLKIQHGVVPIEADGSARFLVPAERNIFLQVLDSNYRALQTERTYVNYMAGEVRSCVGCHEPTTQSAPSGYRTPLAMKRKAELPRPQLNQPSAQRTLSYARDVQPVWDKHCIACHHSPTSPGKLNLSGKETRLFNESYESLVPNGYVGSSGVPNFDRKVLGHIIGENHWKTENVSYLPPRSLGSTTAVLVAMLAPDVILPDPEAQKRAENLAKVHRNIKLTPGELLEITNWVDTNCQYYGTYWGRRNIGYKGNPDYRKEYDVPAAISTVAPASYD